MQSNWTKLFCKIYWLNSDSKFVSDCGLEWSLAADPQTSFSISLPINYISALLSDQINLLCTYETLQMGAGEKCASDFLTGRDYTHNDFLMLSERKRQSPDTGLVWGKDRVWQKERGNQENTESRDEKTKRPSSCQLNRGTDVTTGGVRGGFLCRERGGGTRNGRGAVRFVGTEKARGNDNTHPFAIVLGKERRMEE